MAITSIISVLSVILGAVFLTLITISRVPSHGEEICVVTWIFFYPRSGNRTHFSCQLNLVINFHLSRLLHRLFPFILEHHSRLLHDSFPQILHLHFPVFHHYLHQFVRNSLKLSITYIFNALVCVTRKMIKKMHKSTKTTLIYQLKTIDFRIALCPRWR